MPNDQTRMVPLVDLRTEPGSDELVRSESMKPYLEVLKAEMGGRDTGPALAELAALPLEQRYVWRVISALKWASATSTLKALRRMSLPFQNKS